MASAEQYRRKASECLKLAYSVDVADERRDLLAVAMQWIRLAEEADRGRRDGDPMDAG
jgi:hypothetical protein